MRRYSLARSDDSIRINGPIYPDRVSAAALRRSFLGIDPAGPVRVVIDTPGGSCAEGLALYTILRECGRRIEVTIRAAFSMGAIVAEAGHTVAIEATGAIGLHAAGVAGDHFAGAAADLPHHVTAEQLRRLARGLWSADPTRADAERVLCLAATAEAADATHLDVLSRRTGLLRHELTTLRTAETVLTAERAVALRFADRIIPTLET